MNQKQINQAVKRAIKTGNWMIRVERKDGYSPTCNFKWKPVGEWTEALDWNPKPICIGGLYGQAFEAGGYKPLGGDIVVFCETAGERVIVNGNKIKVPKARRLLVGQLPKGLILNASLDLSYCNLTNIILPQIINDNLYLTGPVLKNTVLPTYVGGALRMSYCDIRKIKLPKYIGSSVYLNKAIVGEIKFQPELYGSLFMEGCNLKRVILPQKVHECLHLDTCDLKDTTLPEIVEGSLILRGCKNVDIPESCTYRDRIIY